MLECPDRRTGHDTASLSDRIGVIAGRGMMYNRGSKDER